MLFSSFKFASDKRRGPNTGLCDHRRGILADFKVNVSACSWTFEETIRICDVEFIWLFCNYGNVFLPDETKGKNLKYMNAVFVSWEQILCKKVREVQLW